MNKTEDRKIIYISIQIIHKITVMVENNRGVEVGTAVVWCVTEGNFAKGLYRLRMG